MRMNRWGTVIPGSASLNIMCKSSSGQSATANSFSIVPKSCRSRSSCTQAISWAKPERNSVIGTDESPLGSSSSDTSSI